MAGKKRELDAEERVLWGKVARSTRALPGRMEELTQFEESFEALVEGEGQVSAKAEKTSAYFGLGKAYQKLKDYTQAVSCYDHILGVDSQDAEAHYQKSKCLIALGQNGRSLEHLALAIKNDDEYREIALEEPAFQVLSGDQRFAELVR